MSSHMNSYCHFIVINSLYNVILGTDFLDLFTLFRYKVITSFENIDMIYLNYTKGN